MEWLATLDWELIAILIGALVTVLGYLAKKHGGFYIALYTLAQALHEIQQAIDSRRDTAEVLREKPVAERLRQVEQSIPKRVRRKLDPGKH